MTRIRLDGHVLWVKSNQSKEGDAPMKIQITLCVLSFLVPAFAFSQEQKSIPANNEYGIFQNQDEYYNFMGNLKTQGAGNPELMAMVPLVNDIVLQRPIGSTGQKYNAAGSTLGLLANEDIRGELEMLDEQYKDLQAANKAIQERAADQLRKLDFSDIQNVAAKIQSIRDQSEQELRQTLLPHQIQRLKQILAQSQLRRRSLVEILTSEPMKSEFEISDVQADDLKSAERKINEDLEHQIEKLREQAKEKLVRQLNSSQRQKVEELFGDAFDFKRAAPQMKRSRKVQK